MKYVILIPDGMADRPLDALGGRTPLEAADTPNMDYVAENGVCGMAKTFYQRLPYDSSIANMSILGYDPRKYFTGRAPLEAVNIGVRMGVGDIAVRCNLITVEEGRIGDFTAGHITSGEGAKLIQHLNREVGGGGVEFHPGVSYRNILVLRARLKHSTDFTAKQPHDIVGRKVMENRIRANKKAAEETAAMLNRLMDDATNILAGHPVNKRRIRGGKKPANGIWLWGAGVKPRMPSFRSQFGLEGSLVSAVDLLKGLGRTIGLDVLDVKGATGYLDTNYEGKADAALRSLKKADLTYIHVESTDEAGHEGSVEHKLKAIEDVDRRVLGRILDRMDGDYAILLMPDHATPIEVRTHTEEPVPYAIYDTRRGGDDVKKFSEREIKEKGSQPQIEAHKLMKKLTGP